MLVSSLFNKLIFPVSVLTLAGFTPPDNPVTRCISLKPDSTLTIPIEVFNKDGQPTIIVEKEVTIPQGYVYVKHDLSLNYAFPIEGTEQATDWITGPADTWSINAKRMVGCKQPDYILLRATAAPGRRNHEIGAKVTLRVQVRKAQQTN